LTEQEIREKLAAQHPSEPVNPFPSSILKGEPEAAAVLIPLLHHHNEWHLLYIRRTEVEGDIHSGQVAFPGGRAEARDSSAEMTALRETEEEIGLKPEDVRVLGHLPDFFTITNYRVTPVVGVMPWPYELRLASNEVVRAFTIPLSWLCDPANRQVRQRELPEGQAPLSVIYFKPYDDEVLWGASARITVNLLAALGYC